MSVSSVDSPPKLGGACRRPPALEVNEDAPMRRDVDSEEVRSVHPELRLDASPSVRHSHLRMCDARAYESIRDQFPDFTPPTSEC